MINELNHVGIVVRDLDASLAFYQRAFGAVIVFQRIIPASQTDVVYLQMAGGMVELSVEEEGSGIPEAKLEHIFDRFYSERPQGEQFGTHSGLGLSISRQIVEALKGKISAENRRGTRGQVLGARFVVRLPRA